ncbi:MAG: hypothetical protein ACYC8T_17065 [Myxococcaceae bacterium]
MTFAPRIVLIASALLALAGCAVVPRTGTAATSLLGQDPVSHVELTVRNLSRAEADTFRDQLGRQGGLKNVSLRSWASNSAVFELDVEGCECDLPSKVAAVAIAGFKYEGRTTKVAFTAFDNKPPTVTFVHPDEGRVMTEAEQFVTVEIPDQDLAEVTLNGQPMQQYKGNLYRAKLKLAEGPNELVVLAKDKTGNQGKAQVRAAVDTTPPSMEATVRVVVEGQVEPGSGVLIDGREVTVEANGHYKAEVPVRKGQKKIEIIAIDANGNKSVTMKDIGI